MRLAEEKPPTTTLASGIVYPKTIAIDATRVYFGSTSLVMKVPLSGGTPMTLVSGLNHPDDMAVDATSVYFTSKLGNSAGVFILTPK